MTAFTAIFTATFRQLTGRKLLLGFGLLSLVPVGIFYLASRGAGPDDFDEILATLILAPLFTILVPIMSLVLSGAALGDERTDHTLSFLILRPVSRWTVASAKTLAAAAVSTLFGGVAALGLTGIYVSMGGAPSMILATVLGAAISCTVYAGVFTLLGYLASKSTLVGLVYVFLIENALLNLVPRLANLSAWRIGFSAMNELAPEGFDTQLFEQTLGSVDLTTGGAILKTALILVICVGILGWLLNRRDAV